MVTQASVQAEVPSRRRRSDALANRTALLGAARELIAQGGPEALTVVAVARRAGLNRSTAYQHFRSREDLMAAVSGEFAREARLLFAEPRSFGAQVDFFVRYFCENPDFARIWMAQLLDGTPPSAPGWSEYLAAMDRLASSPRSQDDLDAEMLGVIGVASALVWSLMARARRGPRAAGHRDTERFARELKRLFLFGALRPESWPDLVSELREGGPASGA